MSTEEDKNHELQINQAVLSTKLEQIKEDYQTLRSRVLAYKEQVDFQNKQLEDERRRAQGLQERIDTLKAEVNLVRVWSTTIQWWVV